MNDLMWIGKTLMVIVPHEDDEINLTGATIYKSILQGIKVVVVFVTNGDWFYPAPIRFKEAINALKTLGVPQEDIVFLGYPDSGAEPEKSVLVSGKEHGIIVNGHAHTYGSSKFKDFATNEHGYAQTYRWENLLTDLQMVILKYRPTTIIGTDFDNHPDHRMCSIALDAAMGKILNRRFNDYFPIYLKGFAYSVAFQGNDDLFLKHLKSSEVNKMALRYPEYSTDNPVLSWEKRIRVPVERSCRTIQMDRNIIFKALCCHESQKILARASRIINGDQVFWQRRTDNLIHQGKVVVSSGHGEYLFDFLLMNVENICVDRSPFVNYCWTPHDKNKWCRCTFSVEKHIESISLWGNIEKENQVLEGKLFFSNGYTCQVGPLLPNGEETKIKIIPQDHVKWVEFKMVKWKGENPGVSEWGIYSCKGPQIPIIHILCNDEFAYTWKVWNGEHIPCIKAYTNGIVGSLRWFVNGEEKKSENEVMAACREMNNYVKIRVEAANNPLLYDEIEILHQGYLSGIAYLCKMMYNKVFIRWNKIKRARKHHQLKKKVREGRYIEEQ